MCIRYFLLRTTRIAHLIKTIVNLSQHLLTIFRKCVNIDYCTCGLGLAGAPFVKNPLWPRP